MRVLVTGASGFVGGAVVRRLRSDPAWTVRAALRAGTATLAGDVEVARVASLAPDTDWTAALASVDAVVLAAARVHVMRDDSADPLAEFRRVNVDGTLALARQAARAGVCRFVFLSSIKVNGERTRPGQPFTAGDVPAPVDPYGVSKREAEDGLRAISRETGLEVVVIRPVLVYGPGVKGNFLAMLRWLERGVPLPLGAIHNRRSLVALDNLVDLIAVTLRHAAAANETFLVSDGVDLSTSELLRRAARAMKRAPRLLPVPAAALRLGARLLGRDAAADRLLGSLTVDIASTVERLGWTPPVAIDDALSATARDFHERSPA